MAANKNRTAVYVHVNVNVHVHEEEKGNNDSFHSDDTFPESDHERHMEL